MDNLNALNIQVYSEDCCKHEVRCKGCTLLLAIQKHDILDHHMVMENKVKSRWCKEELSLIKNKFMFK